MEKLYDTHVINLLRIGRSSENISNFLETTSNKTDVFFMLDYFNLLLHKRLDAGDKTYSKFLGIEENFTEVRNDSISDKLLALYCVAKKEEDGKDIFDCSGGGSDTAELSETPFLGLIQIIINPEYYDNCGYVCGADFVDRFLIDCENIIHQNIEDRFENSKDKYELFRALTSGNFYLVMRASSMQNIYRVSYVIDMITYQYKESCDQSYNMFSTYTNIGIEFGKDLQGNYKTFSEDTVYLCKDDEFAIRLTCSNGFQTDIIENAESYGIKGVFGKYDLLLRITMEDFAAIYPYFCQHILGKPMKTDSRKELELSYVTDVRELLIQGLESGCFKVINECALIFLNKDNYTSGSGCHEYPEDGIKTINSLLRNCRRLEEMEQHFTCGRRSFLDGVKAVNEMIVMYSSLRFEPDTYINWRVLCKYLKILNDTLIAYIKDLIKHKEDTGYQQHFVKDLKTCANAINQYIKFLQGINQQAVQPPQYEIHPRVDSEKLMMAYMEYMDQFLTKYYQHYQKSDPRTQTIPIIYPDITCNGVEVETPFNKYMKDNKHCRNDIKQLMICRIPSFGYFGRFYNLLPVITHEISHNIRILPRRERNELLLTIIFKNISLHIVHTWLLQNDKESITYRYGLLKKELADQLSKDFIDYFVMVNRTEKFYIADEFRIDDLKEIIIEFFNRFYDHNDEMIETEVNFLIPFKEKMKYLAKNIMDLLYRYDIAEEDNINYVQELLTYSTINAGVVNKHTEAKRHQGEQDSIESMLKEHFQILITRIAEEVYLIYINSLADFKENCPDIIKYKFDEYIEEVNIFNYKLQQLYLSQERGLHKPINKNGKVYMAILKDYCEEQKKLNYICFLFYKLMINVDAEKEKSRLRLREIKGLDNRLRGVIEAYYDKSNFRYVILDSRLNNILIATGMALDNKEDTNKEEKQLYLSLYNSMKKCGIKDIRCWAEDIINLYRETCADIIMCKTLGFSPFGYFKLMFFTISESMNDASDYNPESINIRRVRLVLAVLLKSCGHSGMILKYDDEDIIFDAEPICKAANTYCQSLLKDLKPIILNEILSNDNYRELRDDYIKYITQYFNYTAALVDKIFVRILTTPWAMLSVELRKAFSIRALFEHEVMSTKAKRMDQLLHKYDYVFTRLKIMYEGLCNVMTKGTVKVDKSMFNHMMENYHKCTFINRTMYSNQQIPIEEMRLFYNSTDPSPRNFSSDEKLDHMIKFVENYYYLNRLEFKYSEGMDKKEGFSNER